MTKFILFSHSKVKITISYIKNLRFFSTKDKIIIVDAGNQFFVDKDSFQVLTLENLKINGNDNIVFVLPNFDDGVPEELKAFTYIKLHKSNPNSLLFAKEQKEKIILVPWS